MPNSRRELYQAGYRDGFNEGYKQALEDVGEILYVDCDTTLDRFYLDMDDFKELKERIKKGIE